MQANIDDDALAVFMRLEAKHNAIVDQFDTVLTFKDAPIHVGERVIEPGSPEHRGVRLGIALAKEMLGEFPLSISES